MSAHPVRQSTFAARLVAAFVGALCVPANAVPVTSETLLGGSGIKQWSDNSAEFLIKGAGNTNASVIEVGDTLRSILAINTVENISPVPSSARPIGTSGVDELSALFQILVTSKTCTSPGVNCTFAFGASAPFAASLAGFGFAGPTAGATVAFFTDTSPDFNRQGATVAASEATATDGEKYLLLGLTGANAFWTAFAFSDNINALPAPPLIGGFFNAGLNVLQNYTGMNFLNVACGIGPTAFCVSGTLSAPGGGPYPAWNNVDLTFNVVPDPNTFAIPESNTFTMFGVGLAGLGICALRRRKRTV
jgi:hypothetical protein